MVMAVCPRAVGRPVGRPVALAVILAAKRPVVLAVILAVASMMTAACGAKGSSQAPAGEQGTGQAGAQAHGQAHGQAPGPTHGQPGAGEGDEVAPGDLVKLRALASSTHIAPGDSLVVAAQLDIAPGWHIYWENPGESGLSTDLEIAAPEGFALGTVRYPGPVRFESPGPVTSYGYAGQVLLSAQVKVPETLAETSYEVALEASWLACRTACVRGRAKADLALPVATAAEPAAPVEEALFAAHAARLPQPFGALAGAQHAWSEAPDGTATLVLSVPDATGLAFFPATDNQLTLARQEAETGGGKASLRLAYKKAPGGPAARAHGVLEVAGKDGARFYEIDVPRPGAGAP